MRQVQATSKSVAGFRNVRMVGLNLADQARGGINNYIHQLYHSFEQQGCSSYVLPAQIKQLSRIDPYVQGEIVHIPKIIGAQTLLFGKYDKSIVTVLDLGPRVFPDDKLDTTTIHRLMFSLSILGIKRADQIITISDYTKNQLIQKLRIPDAKITTIYLGVDKTQFHPILRTQIRQRLFAETGVQTYKAQPLILYVGSELRRKNLLTLWQSLDTVTRAYPNAVVLKVGSAGGLAYTRQRTRAELAQSGHTNRVTFIKGVSDATLALCYQAADMLVQPSLCEGFSLPVVEAMACGCPVIAADATCLPEIVADAGALFNPLDSHQLGTAITRVFEDRIYRDQLIERGLQRAAQFSWQDTGYKTVAIYKKVSA